MEDSPKISVITAVFNGEKYLDKCIESIYTQTFQDFEHIIVNDGSTDSTPEILERWQKRDSRIRVLHNPENKGRSHSRNRAVTAARSPLIAVIDADDYSLPARLDTQYSYLLEHPEVQVLGGDFLIHGTDERLSHPQGNDEIRANLFFDSSLFHSTVMMRKTILTATRSFYDPALPLSQDYGLWASLMMSPDVVFANLHEPLTYYRLPETARPGYSERQFNYANNVRVRILQNIGIEPDRTTLACHLALLYQNAGALGVSTVMCAEYGQKLSAANAKKPLAAPAELDRQISERVKNIFARDILERKKQLILDI